MPDHAEHLMSLFSKAYSKQDDSRRGDTAIHASNLINFCPRTYYLCKHHDRGFHGNRYVGMDMGWTFDMGFAIQKMQVNRLMSQQVLFGTWECRHCGHMEVGLQETKACPKCKCKAWRFKDLGVELQIPVATKPKSQIVVRGHVDFVVALSSTRGFVVDAKSIKAEEFDKLTNEASIDYQRQVQIYMWMLNHKRKKIVGPARDGLQLESFVFDPRHAVICYGVKGARQVPIKPILVEQNPKFIKTIENKLQALADSLEKKELPEKICKSQADMMAKACVARDICFEQSFRRTVA